MRKASQKTKIYNEIKNIFNEKEAVFFLNQPKELRIRYARYFLMRLRDRDVFKRPMRKPIREPTLYFSVNLKKNVKRLKGYEVNKYFEERTIVKFLTLLREAISYEDYLEYMKMFERSGNA